MACLIVAEQKGNNLDYEQLKVHQNFLYSVYIIAQKRSLWHAPWLPISVHHAAVYVPPF